MCGICGIYGEANDQVIRRMLDVIRHRGPDESAVILTDKYSFGCARLVLVPGNHDRQPGIFESGSLIVLLNGEIYNYRELITEHQLILGDTASEIEVLAALYKLYGLGALRLIKGMFAIALLDHNTLVLARDRFGIKPLFYTRTAKCLVFASEMKALLRHPDVEARINVRAVQETAVFGFICSPGISPLVSICQVVPGTALVFAEGKLEEREYGARPCLHVSGNYPVAKPFKHPLKEPFIGGNPRGDESNLASRLDCGILVREILQEAVRMLMNHGNDRKGLYLSGGIDSSFLTVLASTVSEDPVLTLTLYDESECDDRVAAQVVAKAIRAEHVEFRVNLGDYIRQLPHFVYHYENLIAGGVFDIHGSMAFHMLCERVARYVRVAFSGEGADELFGGYYWSHLHPLGLSDRIRERERLYGAEIEDVTSTIFPLPEDEATYQVNVFNLLMGSGLYNYHLWSVDRSSSAFGFEIRPPYLFDDLVDYVLALPLWLKILGDETKRLLRAAALPIFERLGIERIIYRHKVGMPAAVQHTGRQVEEYAAKLISESNLLRKRLRANYYSSGLENSGYRSLDIGYRGQTPQTYFASPLEALVFDLFHLIFIEQSGTLQDGFDITEYYGVPLSRE